MLCVASDSKSAPNQVNVDAAVRSHDGDECCKLRDKATILPRQLQHQRT
jgi:hypothetical protein